jgi:hypothetical protein
VKKSIGIAVFVSTLTVARWAAGQGMLLDLAADKVIAKYNTATCEQLKQQKEEPKSDKEKAAIEFLRNDAQARQAFLDKVAAPVANKLFECGMIP